MQITRSDTQKGPSDWFTGDVYISIPSATPTSSARARASGTV